MSEERLVKSASQGVVVSVDGNFIRDIAKRACELQGLPPDGWLERLNPDQRLSFERGVAHTLRAMQSLGWKFVPPGT